MNALLPLLLKLLNSPQAIPLLGQVLKYVIPDKEWWKSLTVTASLAWGLIYYWSTNNTFPPAIDSILDSVVALTGKPNVAVIMLFLGIRRAVVTKRPDGSLAVDAGAEDPPAPLPAPTPPQPPK